MPLGPLAATAVASTLALAGVAVGAAVAHGPPKGKGVFVRSVRHAKSGPSEMVADLKRWGFSWVAIEIAWQWPDRATKLIHHDKIPAYCKALRKAGIEVWAWAWPEPGRAREIVVIFDRLQQRGAGFQGLIMDPEGPYQGIPEEVASLDVSMLELLDVPLGCTTYGGPPSWHPRFPWKSWARCDFGIPQLYDPKHKYSDAHVQNTLRGWRHVGFTRLIPAWGASDKHSPLQMADEIRQTQAGARAAGVRFKAVAWWDYYWLRRSRSRQAIAASYKIGKAAPVA